MSDRFVDVVLADPEAKLPMPGSKRLFGARERVDSWDPFWIRCLDDGSVVVAAAAPAPAMASAALGETLAPAAPAR